MAYPLLLAAVAASAVGTGMQMAGAAKSRAAVSAARAAERKRQNRFEAERDTLFQQSLSENTKDQAETDLAQGEQGRLSAFSRLAQLPIAGSLPKTATGPTTVEARDTAATNSATNAWSNLTGKAKAKLGSYGDWGLKTGIRLGETNQDLGLNLSQARGSAGVLPLEIEAASHEGDALAGWGSLAQALGAVGAMGAAVAPANPYPGLTSGPWAKPPW